MIHIFLRSSGNISFQISDFEQFLETYNLEIINRIESRSTIELVVNTISIDEIKMVSNYALDFFRREIKNIRINVSVHFQAETENRVEELLLRKESGR